MAFHGQDMEFAAQKIGITAQRNGFTARKSKNSVVARQVDLFHA
jgi:hypothetical protein